jgi:hypothetical protein
VRLPPGIPPGLCAQATAVTSPRDLYGTPPKPPAQ